MIALFPQQTGRSPASIRLREVKGHPELAGRTLADYLTARGKPPTIEAAVNALITLQLEGGFIGIFTGMDDSDIDRFVRHPRAMFETDGDLVRLGSGFPHPRSYGSFPRVLARYVRDKRVLTLEDAVHRMTQMPAYWLGESDRGVLARGKRADIVVFDSAHIQDRAEYTDPHHYSEGVKDVIVNGVMVLENEKMTGAKPGEFLRRGRKAH
jgi:N-acyl-D-aspartate/D-glutamate deacylase